MYVLELQQWWPFKTRVGSATSGLLSSCEEHFSVLLEAWEAIGMPLEVKQETQGPFPVDTGILRFLSIFKMSQASSLLKH